MNYAELVSTIQSYTENSFPSTVIADGSLVTSTTQIDTIIRQAEQRIYNVVPLAAARKSLTLATISNSPTLSTPADFLYAFSLAIVDSTNTYKYLLVKDPNFILEAYPNPSSTGVPKYYAIKGRHPTLSRELEFVLGPTPNDEYEVDLQYYAYPESIVTTGTSWLGDNYDTALLYACLLEAAVFMKAEADTLAMYGSRLQEAMAPLRGLATGEERGDMYRNKPPKTPVA